MRSRSPGDVQRVAVSALSVTFAALTGLASHFRWNDRWKDYSMARLAIATRLEAFKITRLRTQQASDQAAAMDVLIGATQDFLDEIADIERRETAQFFAECATDKQRDSDGPQ